MAIRFRCSCGKSMQAKEDFAGRRYKCPQCEKIVRIPIPKAKPQAVPAAVAVKTAPVKTAPKPMTPPLAKTVPPPLAKPVHVQRAAVQTAPSIHPWVDTSLVLTPTPWLPGDEARFQVGVKPVREGMNALEKLILGIVIVGGFAGAIVAFVMLK